MTIMWGTHRKTRMRPTTTERRGTTEFVNSTGCPRDCRNAMMEAQIVTVSTGPTICLMICEVLVKLGGECAANDARFL